MKARVTQTDIARAAGVHNTTVSLALRNSRLIPETTRQRIQTIAETMGYCRDPALTALVAYRNSQRLKRHANTLAYITNWETKWGWRDQPLHEKHYIGAQRQAAESGYNIEHFWLGEEGMSQRRLSDMLLHRGINGVLLAAHRPARDTLSDIDWSRLSAVKIGFHPHFPALHQITEDHGNIISLAMHHIRRSGYHRIGLILPHEWDRQVDQAWSKAFFAEQFSFSPKERLPILRLEDPQQDLSALGPRSAQADDMRAFSRWYRDHAPDVIVGLSPAALAQIRQHGLRVPHDVPYVDLLLENSDGIAGVSHHGERVGELAVEMLAAQLQQNIFGVPPIPTTTSTCGRWTEGASLPVAGLPALREATPEALRSALAI